MITKAKQCDLQTIHTIVQDTIGAVYPHYYPTGAVRFFQDHHCIAHVERDIADGKAYLLHRGDRAVGTVTIDGSEINRLFVLPAFQGKGGGRELMDFAEERIAQQFDAAMLSSSFPAQEMYVKRGYAVQSFQKILCENGDYLCYYLMQKRLT